MAKGRLGKKRVFSCGGTEYEKEQRELNQAITANDKKLSAANKERERQVDRAKTAKKEFTKVQTWFKERTKAGDEKIANEITAETVLCDRPLRLRSSDGPRETEPWRVLSPRGPAGPDRGGP